MSFKKGDTLYLLVMDGNMVDVFKSKEELKENVWNLEPEDFIVKGRVLGDIDEL